MGGGIAINFLNAGIPVTLVEREVAALDRGLRVIRKNYERSAAKGRMSTNQVEELMGLITPTVELGTLSDADLIIEAVFEDMAVKQDLFAQIDKVAKDNAILASNTSYLDINQIASTTSRPENVVGMHFFSPANVMRLLEIVRGAKTSDTVLATSLGLAKTIGKIPVVSGVGHGFIANRVMGPRSQQAMQLVLEGPSPQEIDQALFDYGFRMGPFAMSDLVGLDVIGRGSDERSLRGDLVKLGRLGQKQGGGFYDYDDERVGSPSPVAEQIIADFAAYQGVEQKGSLSAAEIVVRVLFPVVNEGAKVLEEGIAMRASDIDVACILGYNWPVYTGGPMFWADTVGLPKIIEALETMNIEPAQLLRKMAASGEAFVRG